MKQKYRIGYDQIPLSEASDYFDTFDEVIKFAQIELYGDYHFQMSMNELQQELNDNGYYIEVV